MNFTTLFSLLDVGDIVRASGAANLLHPHGQGNAVDTNTTGYLI